MDRLLQDVRFALRSFAQTPGFTALALLTVALGIGLNATVFGFLSALLLRPAAGVRDPGTLVSIFTSDFSSGPYGTSSYPDFVTLKREAAAFSGLAAALEARPALAALNGHTERLRATTVSGDYFDVIGVQPALGRAIVASDAPASVAVISDALWQRVFAGAPSAIGAAIVVDGLPVTVVGVAPRGFEGLNIGATVDLWMPMAARDDAAGRGNRSLTIVGRLADSASMQQAQAQVTAIAARLAAEFPRSNRGTLGHPNDPRPMTVVPHTRLHPRFRAEITTVAVLLMAAVAVVLVIVCANVAGLLLSRSTARSREVAVRMALGASRGRILRQMLTESLMLSGAGGAMGLLFALWTADALPSFFPAEQARLLGAGVDWRVVSFTAAAALASGFAFGLAPAFHGMRATIGGALRGSDRRTGEARGAITARNGLVVAQVALASMLLVSAVLLTRSIANGMSRDFGFSTRQAVLASIELPSGTTRDRALAYYDSLLGAVNAIPGVEQSSVARIVPVAGGSRRVFAVPGYTPRQGEDMELQVNAVHRDYFTTMGIRLSDGRLFERTDAVDAPVVVVNDVFADRYFQGHAVGRRITSGRDQQLEIIGVVHVRRWTGLEERLEPIVFSQFGSDNGSGATLVARTTGDPRLLLDTIRRVASGVNTDAAVFRTVTLEDQLADGLVGNNLTAALVATCGALSFVLAIVGLYGIVAYAAVRRTREIGIRTALGARPGQVLALLLRQSGAVVGLGIGAGLLGALAATRLFSSLLYGVSATDPATFLGVSASVALAALAASCIPALRALRISPVAALRQE